jgi:class 3 adenylate cyclase/tetratricopeptide (TPR) repeat protein
MPKILDAKGDRVHKTFLFTDIVKSTDIRAACIRQFGDIGNQRYDEEVLSPHDEILNRLVAEFRGQVVGTAGDSYFITFDGAQSAVQCAVSIQRELITKKIALPVLEPSLPSYLQVRIGLHTGGARELLRAGKTNYSDHTINIAARIEGLADGEQVLMSEDTWENAGRLKGIEKHEWIGYELKGVDGTWTLVEAHWEGHGPRQPQLSPPSVSQTSVATIEAFNAFGGRVEIVTDVMLAHQANPKRIQQFYAGAKLDWDIIAARADIPRDQADDFSRQASQVRTEMRVVCIVAEAGAGKSTSAWRVAADLVQQHEALVLHIKDNTDPEAWYRMPEFCLKVSRPFYVLVDDIFHDPDATSAFKEISPWLPITVVATSRPNEYRPERMKCEKMVLSLNPPSLHEKKRVLVKLGRDYGDLTHGQQRRLDSATQFLVLMIELTEGKDLAEIVRDSVERLNELDESASRAYEYLCFASQFSIGFPVSLLERLDEHGRFYNLPERETAQGLIFWGSSQGYVRVGHPIIAATAAKVYAKSRSPQAVLRDISAAVGASNRLERNFFAFLLRALAKLESAILASMPQSLEGTISSLVQSADRIFELTIWRSFYDFRGEYELAERCLDLAFILEPASSWECLKLLNLYRDCKRERDALPVLAKWIRRNPEQGGVRGTYLRLVEDYAQNDIDAEIQETISWLMAHPDDYVVRKVFLGLVERNANDELKEATIAATREWLSTHPLAKEVWDALVSWLFRSNRSNEAAALAQSAISHSPNDQNLLTHLLRAAQEGADKDTVVAFYERLIKAHPKQLRVKMHHAAWLRDQGHYDESELLYKSLIEEAPKLIQAHYGYGTLLRWVERYEAAANEFRKALQINSRHQMAHNGLGKALWKLDVFDEAEKELWLAIKWAKRKGERLARFYTDLGWFYLSYSRLPDALSAFELARDEDPEHFGNYWGIGKVLYDQAKYATAEKALRTALEKEPNLEPPASEEISELLRQCLQRLSLS